MCNGGGGSSSCPYLSDVNLGVSPLVYSGLGQSGATCSLYSTRPTGFSTVHQAGSQPELIPACVVTELWLLLLPTAAVWDRAHASNELPAQVNTTREVADPFQRAIYGFDAVLPMTSCRKWSPVACGIIVDVAAALVVGRTT